MINWKKVFSEFYDKNESGGSSRWLVAPNIVELFIENLLKRTPVLWHVLKWENTMLPSGHESPGGFRFYCPWCKSKDPKYEGLTGAMITEDELAKDVGNGGGFVWIRNHFKKHMQKQEVPCCGHGCCCNRKAFLKEDK